MRRAAKVDHNQAEVVAALRKIGASVQPIHQIGKGVPDILCGMAGINVIFEIKDGSKPPSARKLTPDEAQWHAEWRGQVHVVESPEEAITLMRELANGHAYRRMLLNAAFLQEAAQAELHSG